MTPALENGNGSGRTEVTRLLVASRDGDRGAFERLIPLVYDDLRRIARARLRGERVGHTLDTTALVHETYLRLVDQATAEWQDRTHFFAVASRIIRNILVDHARHRDADKRGGDWVRIPLRPHVASEDPDTIELLALDEALTELESHDERLARLVECRFFGGMGSAEAAEALGVSRRTVQRDWLRARAYLFDALDPRASGS